MRVRVAPGVPLFKYMKLPTLYARTQTGAIQQWSVYTEENKYQTVFGQVDGKLQTTNWTICQGTNMGRSNERSPEQQAEFEAEALWKKKKDSGYFENVSDIDISKFVEPMLAKNFEDYKDKISFPVYCQPKLDGIRCVVTKDGMYSRNGKEFNSCPHIQGQLEEFFLENPDVVLDGELYNHDLKHDFNKITSLVKKTKPTQEDLNETEELVEYWIYDIAVEEKLFNKRSLFVKEELADKFKNIKVVLTDVANNQNELDQYYASYLDQGYEGQMVRLNKQYENKRSKTLLKRKEFQDREYTILNVIEGEGNKTGMAGAMVFENELGISFNSNIKGDRDYLKEIWASKQSFIGKAATVKFFNLTPDNKLPRFPYVIKIREDFDVS
jgi:DNA ligase-1